MDWMAELGGSVAATLPLLGAFFDEPFDSSPYSPATRLFWNEFYIDLQRIPEFAGHSAVEPPKKTKFVDYRGVMAYKRRILEELSCKFFSDPAPERLQAFRRFVRENKGVEDYARFRAVMDRRRTGPPASATAQFEGAITTKPRRTIISTRSGSFRNSSRRFPNARLRAASFYIWISRSASAAPATTSGETAISSSRESAAALRPIRFSQRGRTGGFLQ
jgi:hypothetical protein